MKENTPGKGDRAVFDGGSRTGTVVKVSASMVQVKYYDAHSGWVTRWVPKSEVR